MQDIVMHVGNVQTDIDGVIRRTPLYHALDDRLSYSVPGAYFSQAYRNKFWDGKEHLFDGFTFPTGVLPFVIEILKEHGREYRIFDERIFPDNFEDIELIGVELHPYQRIAAAQMLRQRRGVCQIPTGGGKTYVAAAVIKALNVPTIYIVHTKVLLTQTFEAFREVFPSSVEVGMVGSGRTDFRQVTIAMVQSIMSMVRKKNTDIFKHYRALIVDEAHHLGSVNKTAWYKASEQFENAIFRYGLSATVTGKKSSMLLQAATGPIIVKVPVADLQAKEFISESRIQFMELKEPKIPLAYPYEQVYAEGIIHNSLRNMLGIDKAVEHAMKGQLVMIFVDRIEHGQAIHTELATKAAQANGFPHFAFLSGEDDRDYIDEIKNLAKKRTIKILIVTRKLFGEGVDIPAIDVLINLAAGKSMVVFTQMFGRGLRRAAGKDFLQYYDFKDETHRYLRLHAKQRMVHCKRMKQVYSVLEVKNVAGDQKGSSVFEGQGVKRRTQDFN